MPICTVLLYNNVNDIEEKRRLLSGSKFRIWLKQTQVTSLVEGELSEPDDVVLDSSSADMDFPFSLCKRAK